MHAHMHICKMKRCLLLTVHGKFDRNRNIKYDDIDKSLKDYVRSTYNWGWSFIKYLRWQVTFICEMNRCLLLPEQGKVYKNRFRNTNYGVLNKSFKVYVITHFRKTNKTSRYVFTFFVDTANDDLLWCQMCNHCLPMKRIIILFT